MPGRTYMLRALALFLLAGGMALGATPTVAQVITKGRVIVDHPKSTAPGTNCKIVNVRVVQSDGSASMQPRRICK